MSEGQKGSGPPKDEAPKDSADASSALGLLKSAVTAALPVVVSAVVSVGFVAFAGSVIVWTRYFAAHVPPDQAVSAFPRHELVAIGASLLVLCGFFGALAVLAIFLIDRHGRATPGMSRGLIVLVMFEGIAVIAFAGDRPLPVRVASAECVVLALAGVLWATFVGAFVRFEKDLVDRDPGEGEIEQQQEDRPFRLASGASAVPGWTIVVAVVFAVALGAVGALGALLFDGRLPVIGVAGLTAFGAALGLEVMWCSGSFYRAQEARNEGDERGGRRALEDEEGAERKWAVKARVLVVGALALAFVAALVALPLAGSVAAAKVALTTALATSVLGWGYREIWVVWRKGIRGRRDDEIWNRQQAEAAKEALNERHKEFKRLSLEQRQRRMPRWKRVEPHTEKPPRMTFSPVGHCVVWTLGLLAILAPAAILGEPWLIGSLLSAAALTFGLWRIAELASTRFIWYGLAIFISVPLFGTLSWMAHNLADPQVQPIALIRSTDGPDEAIQGIYVTEASHRVYFANVATEGCRNEIAPESGRLLWVPRKEVVAMSIGPSQDVESAATSALEMAYDLTPSVETPAAGAVSLTVPEKRSQKLEEAEEAREAKEVEAHNPGLDQRLGSPGPAVRPNFGSGLSLVPEIALPGKLVELRLSAPNENVDGFGSRPEGRTLRLNGVPVTLAREGTRRASDAEYVKTDHDQILSLDKLGIYRMREGRPHLLKDEPEYKGPRFVKLDDSRVAEVRGGGRPRHSEYLQIRGGEIKQSNGSKEKIVELGTPTGSLPEVRLASEKNFVGLKGRFLRQAWHSDRIAFEVPESASSGVITIDCGQLAGAPLLRVGKPPVARIEARMRGGSRRFVFDGSHSRDAAGHPLVDRWRLGKRSLGTHKRVVLKLKPRRRPYRVRLAVTDPDGVTDAAELLLLRLPEAFFEFGSATPQHKKRLRQARRSLERLTRRHPPASIELDGNADDIGSSSVNIALSLRRAERVRETLLAPHAQAATNAPRAAVPVILRAFGESCPIVRTPGRQPANRRVDLFLLDPGDTVATPKSCKPGRVEHSSW